MQPKNEKLCFECLHLCNQRTKSFALSVLVSNSNYRIKEIEKFILLETRSGCIYAIKERKALL